MGKQLKRRRRPQHVAAKSVDALTVGWMLMVFTTLACELGALLAYGYVMQFDRQAVSVGTLAGMLLFAACVIGLMSLLVCPVVLRTRRVPPPRSILVFAVVVGFAPLLAAFFASIR